MHRRNIHLAPNLVMGANVVTETFGILGKRGTGKTHTAMVFAEEMLECGYPMGVIDPVGAWWGLRSSADGKRPGYEIVIFGGDHGDVPLEKGGGKVIANFAIEESVPFILDLDGMSKRKQIDFVADFLEQLYRRNKEPLHLFIDEADLFAPQICRRGEGQERALGACDDIIRRGRKKGLGATLITQRSAVINKSVLSQIETLIVHRTLSSHDKAAIESWVKDHGTIEQRNTLMKSLATLPVGEAWFWSPVLLEVFKRVKVRAKKTFDSSKTPEVGKRIRKPKSIAEIDLGRVQELMKETIERAAKENPRLLRQRIRELENSLHKAQAATKVSSEMGKYEEALTQELGDLQLQVQSAVKKLDLYRTLVRLTVLPELEKLAVDARNFVDSIDPESDEPATQVTKKKVVQRPARPQPTRPPTPRSSRALPTNGVKLKLGARKMLAALQTLSPRNLSRTQIATLAGLSPRSGTFSSYLSVLRQNDLIEEGPQGTTITAAGRAYVGDLAATMPDTTEALVQLWGRSLKLGARRMLDVLVEEYPNAMSRAELAERAEISVSSGTFSSYLSALRGNALITKDRGSVAASEALFLF